MQNYVMSEGRRNQLWVALTAAVFVLVAAVLTSLVVHAIETITETSNAIDDGRAKHATVSAVQSLRKQLGATIRDNAYWDDAFKQVNSDLRVDWIVETWGSTTADYPLYDTAIVVDAKGATVVAYRDGKSMETAPGDFFGSSFSELLSAARKSTPADTVPVHFVRSKAGAALIGAAAIQPFEIDKSLDSKDFYVLIFAKHLTPKVVAETSETFNIADLSLDEAARPFELSAPLRDVTGKVVGYFNWPSQAPGTRSYRQVQAPLQAAAMILVLFLCAICAVGILTVRTLRASERRSRHKASHDALTGLLNRFGLIEQIAEVSRDARNEGAVVRLHFIDLDGFKGVNDAWGHGVGDALIIAVASRLRETLPQTSMIARLGGDEFAVVTVEANGFYHKAAVGHQIQVGLKRVFEIGGRTIEIGASVGIAVSQAGLVDTDELIRRADIALYRAKDRGRGTTVEFEDSFDVDVSNQAELERQLRITLSSEGIGVAFQPLVRAETGEVCGVEALARWQSPDGQAFGPDVFIPIAERSGLIDLLGMQVLAKSLEAAKLWPGLGLAVNVSPLQLKNPMFVQDVIEAVQRAAFDPHRLCIEVTEGVLISDPQQAQRAIDGLKAFGIKVALDDFGSGFASIGTLRQFGFDRMKIDRSLIMALDRDMNAGAVLQATIALANALEIPVTAEGIETEAQAMAVRLSGCDELQGYLFSKPVTAEELSGHCFSADRGTAEAMKA